MITAIQRITIFLLTVAAISFGGVAARNEVGWWFPKVVARGSHTCPYGVNTKFGYSVDRPRWIRNGLSIRIWAHPSLEMRFDVPYIEFVRVTNERWLARNRAILLTVQFLYHDSSGTSPGELGIL